MLNQVYDKRRFTAAILVSALCYYYNLPLAVMAAEINQNGVPFKTATNINVNGNITDISTTTTNSAGNIGINTFGRFNVNQGDIVNLNLINNQNKLVNLIFDSSASQINGVVNSYMNGSIGGNVLFANPNGFVVGKSGVFNVGSLTLMTPTTNYMKSLFNDGVVNDSNLDSLISFNMNGKDYMLLGGTNPSVKLHPAEITIEGTINSGSGIDILTGGSGLEGAKTINITDSAILNANMNFSVSGNNVTASPKTGVVPSLPVKPEGREEFVYKLAMDDGNNITIVSSNHRADKDYMSAIVNLNGKINTNGSDLYAQSEVTNLSWKADNSNSEVNVGGSADINARNINLNAFATASTFDHDLLGIRERESKSVILDYVVDFIDPRSWGEAIVDNFVHLGDQKTKVTVENGAKLNAVNDVNIISRSDYPALGAMSVMETFAFNYLDFILENEAIVKSGANIKAGNNLTVQAITDLNLSSSTKSTNIAEIIADNIIHNSFGHTGAYSVSVTLADVINRAVIENGVNLNVENDINVLASMTRDITAATQNGFIPIFDKNRGVAGIGIGVAAVNSTNEAIMNADADIKGALTVNADYAGKLSTSAVASSGSQGEDAEFGGGGKFVSGLVKYVLFGWINDWSDKIFDHLGSNDGKSRLDATFGKIHAAGAINVAVDNAINNAYIGNADDAIKPVINAKNVIVNSTLVDHKSNVYAQSATVNGVTSAAGAIAVNYKGIDSDAKVYGDLTLSGADEGQALIIRSKTQVERPSGLDSLRKVLDYVGLLDYLDFLKNESAKNNVDVTTVTSSNVDAYLDKFGMSDEMQDDIDNSSSIMNMLSIFDYLNFHDLNMHNFFNTFATSQATAKANNGKTSAYAGALTVGVFDTSSNAELVGNSIVNLIGENAAKNGILIQSDTDSTMWAASSLSNLFNFKTLLSGTMARDGDSAGGALSFQWGNIDTTAKIGNGAEIKTTDNGAAGDLNVLANENGQFINISFGNASADESGIGGAIAATVLEGGDTKASIEEDAQITAKDANVKAAKDDNVYHAVFAYTNAENAKSFGVSSIVISNAVEAYIAGNLNASGNVSVTGDYDKMFLNTTVNGSIANTGQSLANTESDKVLEPGDADDEMPLSWEDFMADEGFSFNKLNIKQAKDILSNHETEKYINPDKKTSAYAGNILLNIADNDVKAYIKDGAKVTADGDVEVKATSEDMNIEIGSILAANGKKGGGATATFDLNKNDVQAYIGAAEVDSAKNINVNAKEDNNIVAVSAGIGQAKDKSGTGVVSLDIQRNNVEAAIKDGAKVNTNIDNENQSVSVNAEFDNSLVKAVGALSIQAGEGDGGSVGAAVDGDVAVNDVKAYIKGAEINASNELNVTAEQETNLIDISAAGAVSTQGAAYDGTGAVYVSSGNTDAYIENSQINQTEGRENNGVSTKVSAENTYDNITVTGTLAGGKGNAVGGSIRVDWIDDNVDSYIKDSILDSTGALEMSNNSTVDVVAITAAGAVSTDENAFGGAIMLAVNSTIQNNYIDNSTIKASSVTLDSDSIYDATAVTGALALSIAIGGNGTTGGGSIYTAVADNDINTYVKNSDVTSLNDINLTSDIDIDTTSVIFGAAGGGGMALSGAVSTFVNSADVNTYIKSENNNTVLAKTGKIAVKSTNTIDIDTINGAISLSNRDDAMGAAINTVVDSSDVMAGIEGANVEAKGDVDVIAKSTEDIMSISVGGAVGYGITAAGSVNTVVIASDTDSYIKNSSVTSNDGNIQVKSSGDTKITGGTGSASIAMSSMAIGASIVTGVIDSAVTAIIENSKTNAGNDVVLSAIANETIGSSDAPFITVAGGFSQGLTLEGVIGTMVMSSTADAHIKGTKTVTETVGEMETQVAHGVQAGNDVSITATGKDTIFAIDGAVSASTESGIGATINTVVIDKDNHAYAQDTKITAGNDIKAEAQETDDFFTTMVAGSGGGSVGASGVVNTNVITSKLESGYKNSTLNANNKITSNAKATADMQTITGAVAGGGSAGVGLSAVNDIIKYTAESYATNVNAEFKELDVTASADSTYQFTTVSGAAGGSAGVAGVENVNYVNNTVKAYADGVLKGDKAVISASDEVTFNYPIAGVVAAGGTAGVGASVMVNAVTSTVQSYIGGNNVNVKDIDVTATGKQTYDNIIAAGFAGAGEFALSGTVLVNNIDTIVQSYITENSNITADDVDVKSDNTTTLTAFTGAGAVGGMGAVGASVNVNDFEATTESYTGDNVTINAKNVNVNAQTTTSLGTKDRELNAVAGSFGVYAGIAGSFLFNDIQNKTAAYLGKGNTINLADNGKLNLNAKDASSIYESFGAGGGGLVGVGATVGGNEIHNTVLSYIGSGSVIDGSNADVSIISESIENVDALGVVVGAGGVALSGGAVYTNIGKKVENASYNQLDDKTDRETFDGAKEQTGTMKKEADRIVNGADDSYKSGYNDALNRVKDDADGTRIEDKENVDGSLYTKTATSSIASTDRDGTTSAFIDSGATLNVKNLKVNAKNTNDIDLETDGVAAGAGAVGVSVALSEDLTTTNAFVSNGVTINADSAEIKAISDDKHQVETLAAAGGLIAGGGSHAQINSNKTVNAYVLGDTTITTKNNLTINTDSTSDITSYAKAAAFSGLSVGVSVAKADSTGNAKIDIGDNVSLNSQNSNVIIGTKTDEKATAESWAATGGTYSGSGAASIAKTGKNSSVNIGKDFSADVNNKLTITSNAKNYSFTEANGRAYGGVSAGGATGESIISQTSGVNIADATSIKNIKAGSIDISSKVENKAETDIYAGAGALAGFSGSRGTTDITTTDINYVGKNYNVTTSNGGYLVSGDVVNEYKAYDKADSFGVVVGTAPSIKNTVNSTVKSDSEADIESAGSIIVAAKNEIKKKSVSGYDLRGGAGGIAGGSGGSIEDTLTMTTNAKLGGNKAYANGDFGSGDVTVGTYNNAEINEKADLYAGAAIGGSDTDSIVHLTADAKTEIANKDIKTKDDHINYAARNDIDIYTKVNVESYGGFVGTGGKSEAKTNHQYADIVIADGVTSTSGRDTNVSAISNKSLEAYIYERTRGLASVISGHANAYNSDSHSIVTINSGAALKSYDAMNLTAQSTSQKIKVTRDAIAYQLWGIPYKGSGNTDKSDNNNGNGSIVLNGSTESGLGANKSLTINNDSTYTSDGVNVKGLEQVGEISSAEIQVDIDSYKESLKTAKTEYDAYIKSLDDASDSYSAAMETAKTNKAAYENNNKTLTKNKQAAELSLNAINNVDNIATEDYQTTYGSIADVKTLIDAYNALKSLSVDDEGYAAAKSAYDTAYNALTSQKRSLETQISGYETQIQTNNNSIEIAKDAIEANDLKIKEIAQTKLDAEAMYTQQVGVIQGYIDDLTAQKAEMDASGTTTPVYSMVIDDIIVRSGETNVTGNVTGSGSITAPGNKFTITIDNNSVNSVVYGDLILGRNLKGGIYGSSIADSITKTIKNPNDLYKISITNHVDANDPTINFTGNAGDIVLQGNVENVNGAFDLTNYTGNVLSQGSLTARDIHIKVPNGSMSQQYNSNEYKIGGNSGDGAIIVSHDIDISSKIINIHGLIQSGSEIKQVTIPEFSVIKKDDGYYQVVNGVETFMKPSEMTKGYYYLTLTDDTSDVAKIQQIKAYFKPSDSDATSNIPGEIYLFKADIDGGNITLTGNIVNDKNTGKIVLINGYGHIDVTNNSNYDLVTSALNADTNLQGKLTINDFKVGYNDPEYVTDLFGMQIQTKAGSPKYDEYENIKHSDLTDEFISSHTGTYTAYVDENGNIVTSATGVTEGNGSWSSENQTNSTNSFGANVYSTTYTPGADAYSVVNEGGLRSYTVYVKRSWWTELWYGKLYETRYYTADPTYEVKANPIAVNFQGFSTPQINVTSNSNIIMNNSISALAGNVNITTGGNLLTNTANNVISAKNITLNAAGNIGQEVIDGTVFRPIQAAIYDDGKLSAKGKDVYINFPYTGIGSIDINANNGAGNIYLSANEGNFNGTGKTVDIKADSLDLRADNINLDTSENENIHIDIKQLKATAKDDISITNKSHLKLSSIISENQGTITIVSKEGSIVANENTGTYSPYHINGGDVILKAVNGQIGTSENNLKFANKGTFYVQAKGDVYLDSASTIYVDLIESTQGALTVNADLGIIASAITDENRVYNLASKGDMNLTSATGNIENITVNADGTVNAIAGYDTNGAVSGLSDVNITMASQKQLSHDSTEAEISAFNETAKDLKIGTIKASNNVTLTGEKGIKNASDSSFVSGERIAINAAGDIGTEDSAIDLTANREVTVIGSENSNIYLTTSDEEKGLKINTIDSSANGALANVVITSAGNITNNAEKSEDKETVNIRANNISITTLKDIGAFENELTVETASSDAEKGLSFTANKAYIKGLGDKLNITGGETSDIALITGQSASETIQNSKDTEISVNNFTSGNQVSITSENANVSADKLTVNNDEKLMLETGAKAAVSNSSAKEIDINSTDALVSGTIKSDLVDVNTSNDTEIKNAKVSALTEGNDGLLDVETEGNIDISNSEVNVINTFKAGKDVSVANSTFTTDLNVDKSNNTNITGDLTIEGEAIVSAENKLNINNATIDIDNILSNTDVDIISTTVKGDLNVTTDKNITISDANIKKDLNAIAENINIFEMLLEGNINTYVDNLNLKTSNDLHLGKIQGNSSQYTNNAIIESAQNITNGLSANDKNIYAVNANLKAGNSIGTNGKSVNIAASNGNVISIDAQKTASLDTTGSKANYNKFSAEETILKTDEDIKISNLNTDKLTINTSSSNVDITGSVETNGTIRTADKYVVIDNTSLAPHIEADIQLYLTQKPMHLVLDDTNNIKIESKNVTRYNLGYNVNGSKDSYSMESEITLSAASSVNNTNVGEKVIEKSDKSVYEMPTVADYINEITVAGLKDNNTITNINDGTVSNTNITDFVNVDETSKSDISLNEISVQNEDRIMPKTVQKTKFKFQRGMKKKQAAKTQKKLNYISRAK